jgi:hypothetical protein
MDDKQRSVELNGVACLWLRVQQVPKHRLQTMFGAKTGAQVFNFARGVDDSEWASRPKRNSVGIQVGKRFEMIDPLFEHWLFTLKYHSASTLAR